MNKYHLIALDFPGHGKSDKPENKEAIYSLTGLRDVIVDFIYQHHIGDFIFAGHSLGGHVAIECLPFVSDCKGIMIWGTPPIKLPLNTSELFYPHPALELFFKQSMTQEEIKRLSKSTVNQTNLGIIEKLIEHSDPEFRAFLPASLAKGLLSDEVEILNESKIPKAILHGKDDPFVNKNYLEKLKFRNIYKGKVHYIEKAGHTPQMDQPEAFNNFLSEFADKAFK